MLKFFALYKRKITGISNTAFYHQIGFIFRASWFYNFKLLITLRQSPPISVLSAQSPFPFSHSLIHQFTGSISINLIQSPSISNSHLLAISQSHSPTVSALTSISSFNLSSTYNQFSNPTAHFPPFALTLFPFAVQNLFLFLPREKSFSIHNKFTARRPATILHTRDSV